MKNGYVMELILFTFICFRLEDSVFARGTLAVGDVITVTTSSRTCLPPTRMDAKHVSAIVLERDQSQNTSVTSSQNNAIANRT